MLDRQLIRLLGVDVPNETKLDWEAWHDQATNHPSAQDRGPVEMRLILDDGMQHIDTFRAWVKAFRVMTNTYYSYAALQGDADDLENLASVLTELLQPFSPTIQVRYEHEDDEFFDPFDNTYPRLESILALQMYHHIVADDSYQRCQNEPCGRLFVHQRGRAEHGQYRGSGLKYCSKNCAKAQVERNRRRRNRERDKEQDTS